MQLTKIQYIIFQIKLCFKKNEDNSFYFKDEKGGLELPKPNVLGQFQLENISTAIATLRLLNLDIKDNHVDIIEVAAFDISLFDLIEDVVRDKACNGQNACSAYNRPSPGSEWIYNDTGVAGLGPIPTRAGNGNAGKQRKADPNP